MKRLKELKHSSCITGPIKEPGLHGKLQQNGFKTTLCWKHVPIAEPPVFQIMQNYHFFNNCSVDQENVCILYLSPNCTSLL